jgi:hypothetical protein
MSERIAGMTGLTEEEKAAVLLLSKNDDFNIYKERTKR